MDRSWFRTWSRRRLGLAGSAGAATLLGLLHPVPSEARKKHKKKKPKPDATGILARSAGLGANCIPNASGTIKLFELGGVEKMEVSVSGLPAKTEFDVFVIQQPDTPFGLTWYQGDLTTDKKGNGKQTFQGRFNIETFIVGPGSAPAPQPHGNADASSNAIQAKPVHTFHVGLWFNSPDDAEAANCPNAVTPFNGDHTAGVQALKTLPVDVNGLGVVGPLAQLGS